MGIARKLAWAALAGQVVFIACWVVSGALEPGYSHIDSAVSELGADTAAHPLIVNAGIVLYGLSFVALGAALRSLVGVLPAVLFVAAGIAGVVAGVVPLDCGLSHSGCEHMWRAGELSWHEDAHLWASLVSQLFLAATPFALARALSPGPVAPLAFGAGAFGLVIGVVSFFLYGVDGSPDGLIQRFGLLLVLVWVVIVAVGVLHATRRPPVPGQLVRLRPRDFLAGEWTGTGELLAWPFFLWRRLARPFEAHRSATWISERVWRIDDEADFGGGRVRRRRMYCEFVTDDRVEITAGDLPEGASVAVEDEGYRMPAFRMDFPIGPVSVPIRVHDVSRVEGDGTLLNTFEARALVTGLRLARVTFRVRPVVRASGDGQAR
ncbi:MAG: hypothetical protein QOH30_2638 [Baekduia sp.]|jgi:hypothetical membrane protein|nr:hypothetical protein [Baekduia sp.]